VIPFYWIRFLGGIMYLAGVLVMFYNIMRTVKGTTPGDTEAEAVPFVRKKITGKFHYVLESKPAMFTTLTLIAILIGGIFEIVPMMAIQSNVPSIAGVKPYTPLELEGRDIYIREGCNNCHSQMVRPLRAQTERYGDYSKAGEFVYDHPFLWGSRRTGPDLHRIGGKYPNLWHLQHMEDPRAIVKESIMPPYQWLLENKMSSAGIKPKMKALKKLGVPYDDETISNAEDLFWEQAREINADLANSGVQDMEDKQIIALIAYLQRLGTDIKE
jgi:cytochrome c oxidase cbb3-type subunit I/II